MEHPSKRRRLLTPLDSDLTPGFNDIYRYYDTPAMELDDDDDEDQEYGDSDMDPTQDQDPDLQLSRARLDYKLKSTFESIFEKYGRDFDGVGDEVDLYTGEILVNNGHLREMQDERDAGNLQRARGPLGSLTKESRGGLASYTGTEYSDLTWDDGDDGGDGGEYEGANEDGAGDYDDESVLSDGAMLEDDIILRGLSQASRSMAGKSLRQEAAFDNGLEGGGKWPQQGAIRSSLPSRPDISSQFRPRLGPEIAEYVSQQYAVEDANIEPIWRAPPLPVATSRSRPRVQLQSMALPLENERSPSPIDSGSIWAPADSQSQAKFTPQEDELLRDFVSKAQKRGHDLSRQSTWKQLAAIHPRHSSESWKRRYEATLNYISSIQIDELELPSSGDTPCASDRRNTGRDSRPSLMGSVSMRPLQPASRQPIRVRKQAQRDPTISSWSEAVTTIELSTLDIRTGLLKDPGVIESDTSFSFDQIPSPNRSILKPSPNPRQPTNLRRGVEGLSTLTRPPNSLYKDVEDELTLPSSASRGGSEKVACPHVGCRTSAPATYRLRRYDEEELSPLSLHLLRVHLTTPFPCAEFNCDRKDDRGYFTQEDLSNHVRASHPYSAALDRLRGRVDPIFLGRKPVARTQLRQSTSDTRFPDSDFTFPRGVLANSTHGTITTPQSEGPAALDLATSVTTPSLRVNPSPSVARDTQSCDDNSPETPCHSEIRVTHDGPSLADSGFSVGQGTFSDPIEVTESNGIPAARITTSVHPHMSTSEGAQETHHGCHKVSSVVPRSSITPTKPPLAQQVVDSAPPLALSSSTTPDLSTPDNGLGVAASASAPQRSHRRTRKRTSDPLPINIIDASYAFSDEEPELPPLGKEKPELPPLGKEEPELPPLGKEEPELPPLGKEEPELPPLGKGEPRSAIIHTVPTDPRPTSSLILGPVALATESSSSTKEPPLVTPLPKAKPRKSLAPQAIPGAEDYDELSLGADDLIFISSRPRPSHRRDSGSQTRLKREGTEAPGGIVRPSKKRKLSMIERSDEIDELDSEGFTTSILVQPNQGSTQQPKVKTEVEDEVSAHLPSRGSQNAIKANRHRSSLLAKPFRPPPTPSRSQEQSSGANTPLIDLVKGGASGADVKTPSTSYGSSPSAVPARIRAQRVSARTSLFVDLLTPASKRRRPRVAFKQEEEDGVVESPGGTLRRCGEGGFACGRTFCFTCPGS